MSTYLDFEEPIRALEEQILQTKEIGISTSVDMQDKIIELEKKAKSYFKRNFFKPKSLAAGSVIKTS